MSILSGFLSKESAYILGWASVQTLYEKSDRVALCTGRMGRDDENRSTFLARSFSQMVAAAARVADNSTVAAPYRYLVVTVWVECTTTSSWSCCT